MRVSNEGLESAAQVKSVWNFCWKLIGFVSHRLLVVSIQDSCRCCIFMALVLYYIIATIVVMPHVVT